MKKYIFITLSLFLLTFSQFYHNYKFSDPSLGNNDFFEYEKMIVSPLNTNSSYSPFIYRQFTTLISKFILT